MAYEARDDKDCLGLDDRVALFFWESDAKKFIAKVQEAAANLKDKASATAT